MIGIEFELVTIGWDAAGFPILHGFHLFAKGRREACAAGAVALVATDTDTATDTATTTATDTVP